MSFFGGFLEGFLHGGKLLQLVGILRLLDCFNLHNESIARLDVHGGLDLELLVGWWLIGSSFKLFVIDLGELDSVDTGLIFCNLLNLLPRLLSFGSSLHCFLLSIDGGLFVGLVGLLCLSIVDIRVSLEESSR